MVGFQDDRGIAFPGSYFQPIVQHRLTSPDIPFKIKKHNKMSKSAQWKGPQCSFRVK